MRSVRRRLGVVVDDEDVHRDRLIPLVATRESLRRAPLLRQVPACAVVRCHGRAVRTLRSGVLRAPLDSVSLPCVLRELYMALGGTPHAIAWRVHNCLWTVAPVRPLLRIVAVRAVIMEPLNLAVWLPALFLLGLVDAGPAVRLRRSAARRCEEEPS